MGQVVVPSDRGKIEIIGLRRWTYRMLEDSLARYAPGTTLRSHACAAVLQSQLGFPSAAVGVFPDPTNPKYITTVITVLEPTDSGWTDYRKVAFQKRPVPNRIAAFQKLLVGALEHPLENYDLFLQLAPIGSRYGIDSLRNTIALFSKKTAEVAPDIFRDQHQFRTPQDLQMAKATIDSDTNRLTRVAALGIVSNFHAEQDAWYTLVRTLRDSDPVVRGFALSILNSWTNTFPKTINWNPAQQDLVSLLGGTNLSAYTAVLRLLEKTHVSPAFALELLHRTNIQLLFAHVVAETPEYSTPAQTLLRTASGKDYGRRVKKWQEWYTSTLIKTKPSPEVSPR